MSEHFHYIISIIESASVHHNLSSKGSPPIPKQILKFVQVITCTHVNSSVIWEIIALSHAFELQKEM